MRVAFLLPLGDVVSSRTLLMVVIPLQVAALLLFSASEHTAVLVVACLLIGIFGIVPYVLPPYASLHIPAERVGHVTGVLTRGIIVGILLARMGAGVVGTHLGWREVYWIAAGAMVCVLIALRRFVPAISDVERKVSISYRDLLLSLVHLVRTVPELRTAALCQALSFGSFNVFWLGASLYLQSAQVRLDAPGGRASWPLSGRSPPRLRPCSVVPLIEWVPASPALLPWRAWVWPG
jgi:predicted MFS family arabinose efflux permease